MHATRENGAEMERAVPSRPLHMVNPAAFGDRSDLLAMSVPEERMTAAAQDIGGLAEEFSVETVAARSAMAKMGVLGRSGQEAGAE